MLFTEIQDADLPDAGRGQVHDDGRAETAGADAQNARRADFLLPGQSDFRQNQVTRVTANFVVVQFHKTRGGAYVRRSINQEAA